MNLVKEELPLDINDPKFVLILPPLKKIIVEYLLFVPYLVEHCTSIDLKSVLWLQSLGLCFVPKIEKENKDKIRIILDDISSANRTILSVAPSKGNMELMTWLHENKYYLLDEAKYCIYDGDFRAACQVGNFELVKILSICFDDYDINRLKGILAIDICLGRNVELAEFIWERLGFNKKYISRSSGKSNKSPSRGLLKQMYKNLDKDNPVSFWLKSKIG